MAGYCQTLERLMAALGKLPGIGPRSAERLVFHLLKAPQEDAFALAEAIRDLKTKLRPCEVCFNIAEERLCQICSDPRRDKSTICVVEQPKDLLALESTGAYHGVYHVLMGHVAPLDGVEPEDLTISALLERVRAGGIKEVILATNPDVAGDATALHVAEALRATGVKLTRLARGLPAGGQIEYANRSILTDAITERRDM
ncbi:MAG: recombination protein RecR [Planctomycetales bacterium 4484_123]|nr:MAG: recombination protein RecR [Planctomycetales bacterium 4484_123]